MVSNLEEELKNNRLQHLLNPNLVMSSMLYNNGNNFNNNFYQFQESSSNVNYNSNFVGNVPRGVFEPNMGYQNLLIANEINRFNTPSQLVNLNSTRSIYYI